MRNKYSFSEFLKTAYSLFITKVTYPKARLIRRLVYIREGITGWRKRPYNRSFLPFRLRWKQADLIYR